LQERNNFFLKYDRITKRGTASPKSGLTDLRNQQQILSV
jgi:hypothetical protein